MARVTIKGTIKDSRICRPGITRLGKGGFITAYDRAMYFQEY